MKPSLTIVGAAAVVATALLVQAAPIPGTPMQARGIEAAVPVGVDTTEAHNEAQLVTRIGASDVVKVGTDMASASGKDIGESTFSAMDALENSLRGGSHSLAGSALNGKLSNDALEKLQTGPSGEVPVLYRQYTSARGDYEQDAHALNKLEWGLQGVRNQIPIQEDIVKALHESVPGKGVHDVPGSESAKVAKDRALKGAKRQLNRLRSRERSLNRKVEASAKVHQMSKENAEFSHPGGLVDKARYYDPMFQARE